MLKVTCNDELFLNFFIPFKKTQLFRKLIMFLFPVFCLIIIFFIRILMLYIIISQRCHRVCLCSFNCNISWCSSNSKICISCSAGFDAFNQKNITTRENYKPIWNKYIYKIIFVWMFILIFTHLLWALKTLLKMVGNQKKKLGIIFSITGGGFLFEENCFAALQFQLFITENKLFLLQCKKCKLMDNFIVKWEDGGG